MDKIHVRNFRPSTYSSDIGLFPGKFCVYHCDVTNDYMLDENKVTR